jgi:2,3-dihydroxybenzoate decarboxylase
MGINRRTLIQAAVTGTALLGSSQLRPQSAAAGAPPAVDSGGKIRRIAVEEAFSTPELMAAQRELLDDNPQDEPGFTQFWGTLMDSMSLWDMFKEAVGAPGALGLKRMTDLGEGRLEAMDQAGIDLQLLSVTSPGVQIYDPSQGSDLAQSVNERLAEAVRAHPDRFAGLATIAPQDPQGAARELDRAVNQLGMKGALINSHTKGEFLDDEKFWVIFDKAQALDVPVYIHPRVPSPDMVKPFQQYFGLEAAAFGFPIDASLHALRLILSGVFDDFPRLKIVLGHMGEGLPFWLPRIDKKMALFQNIHAPERELNKPPSQYFHDNFYITTSGMNYEEPLLLAHKVMGADRILFAVDYPFEEAEEPVRFMDNAPISDQDRRKIYQTNAEKLFLL